MMRQVPAAIQALERGWNCSTNIHSKRVAPVSDEERGRRAAERAEKRAAARRLMQQRPPRRVHVEAKPWNGSTKTDSKRVDPATPAQRDQQGLLRMAERQARTLRLQALRCVAFQPAAKWNASTRVTSQEVVVARPRVEPVVAVPRPRVEPVVAVPRPRVVPVVAVPRPRVMPVVAVPRPRVMPVVAVPRPRVAPLVHLYVWNGSSNLHSKARPRLLVDARSRRGGPPGLAMDAPL